MSTIHLIYLKFEYHNKIFGFLLMAHLDRGGRRGSRIELNKNKLILD